MSVAFSPDGKTILTGSYDNLACLYDVETGNQLLQLKGHKEEINALAFSPDGRIILTGSRDVTARLWDAKTGKHLKTLTAYCEEDLKKNLTEDLGFCK